MDEDIVKSAFARVVDRLREINDRLSNVQKMAVSALVVALVLGFALAIWFAHDREYAIYMRISMRSRPARSPRNSRLAASI